MLFEKSSFTGRTFDPDFSYFIVDNGKKMLPTDEYEFSRSFGDNSHHAELLKIKSAVLLIGPVLETGLTLAMHLESKFGVPWRENIETQYFCARKRMRVKHTYFAQRENFPTDRLPRRKNLYPLIRNLETFAESDCDEIPWSLFGWEDFETDFCRRLEENVYFQALARI
jgi:aminoglycoside N3'-acetyltransferase